MFACLRSSCTWITLRAATISTLCSEYARFSPTAENLSTWSRIATFLKSCNFRSNAGPRISAAHFSADALVFTSLGNWRGHFADEDTGTRHNTVLSSRPEWAGLERNERYNSTQPIICSRSLRVQKNILLSSGQIANMSLERTANVSSGAIWTNGPVFPLRRTVNGNGYCCALAKPRLRETVRNATDVRS